MAFAFWKSMWLSIGCKWPPPAEPGVAICFANLKALNEEMEKIFQEQIKLMKDRKKMKAKNLMDRNLMAKKRKAIQERKATAAAESKRRKKKAAHEFCNAL